jgi:ATP-dependent exoDNAse (exonuclease V) beta subunit
MLIVIFLAIDFTNKAVHEMKSRVVDSLSNSQNLTKHNNY